MSVNLQIDPCHSSSLELVPEARPRKGVGPGVKHSLIGFCLLAACLLSALPGCAEGIVLNPPQRFGESEIVLPTPEPSPRPSPSTPVEKIQVKVIEVATKAGEYKGLALPIVLVLVLLFGFIQLLRWIIDLTTSSPPLF